MRNRLWYFILVALVAFSCNPISTDPPKFVEKEKTVLVYIVGNNDLSGYAETNLNQIINGYIPDESGNLLVYYHTPKGSPLLFNIYKNKNGNTIQDTVYKFPVRNSATVTSLNSTLKIVKTMFPANEYGVFLWSHGTGWLPKGYYKGGKFPSESKGDLSISAATQLGIANNRRVTSNANEIWNTSTPWKEYPNGVDPAAHLVKSFGAESNEEMDIMDLAKNGLPYKLSFLVFDACLMGSVEVAYELKDSVDYIISSTAEILANGFPYSNLMSHIFKKQSDLKAVAEEYYNYYKNSSATIALIKTSELNNVAAEAKKIFDKHRTSIGKVDVSNIQRYFRFNKHWFYDLGDYVTNLSSKDEAAPFIAAVNKAVIYKAATPDFLINDGGFIINPATYSGLSIYIPSEPADPQLNEYYKKYKWNNDAKLLE